MKKKKEKKPPKPDIPRMRYVYKYQNQITGEIYIGQTTDPNRRKGEQIRGKGIKKGDRALVEYNIREYGIENFDYDILFKGVITQLELNRKEFFYMKRYNSLYPNGLNIKGMNYLTYDPSLKPPQKNKKNTYVGVYPTPAGKYQTVACTASLEIGTITCCKTFSSQEEAAEAYDKMSLFIYGESAFINFEEKRNLYLTENLREFGNEFLNRPKRTKYKWVRLEKGHWNVRFPKNVYPAIKLNPDLSEIEAAKLADKFAFYYYNIGITKLNFPKLATGFTREKVFEDIRLNFCHESEFEGVHKRGPSWRAVMEIDGKGKRIHIGSFPSQIEAFDARIRYIEEYRKQIPDLSLLSDLKLAKKAVKVLTEKALLSIIFDISD